MPADAPALKIANTSGYGAEVVLYDRAVDDREAIAHKIVAARGAIVVPPFDDPHIIAGQGTVGLELADWATAHGTKIDQVLVCCSGGGLAAGIALGFEARGQKPDIYAVEPEGFDDYGRSLIAGERVSNTQSTGSICDALMSQSPGKLTFAINQPRLKGGLAISDDEARRAVAFAFQTLKLVVEPGGAAALAAALAGKLETRDRVTAIILSGGNVDAAMFDQCLAAA
jgi:threonine dehydratase